MRQKVELQEYRLKRDPTRTNEPFGAERIATQQMTRNGFFVVHQHNATRAHYDLRLQVGRALASFAVPKGPSLNPDDSRLAVQTEQHDLLYLDFEDVIPAGNYGAGPMIVWDFGRIQYLGGTAEQGLEDGKLDFVLDGFKLRGGFVLIETSNDASGSGASPRQWLLRKKSDAFASVNDVLAEQPRSVMSGLRIDELEHRQALVDGLDLQVRALGAPVGEVETRRLVPMLCATTSAALRDPARIFELKLDGARILADRRGDQVTLRYRNGRVATLSYPETVRAVRALAYPRFVLDGEIVAFDEAGRPSFQKLGPRIAASCGTSAWWSFASPMTVYLAFDLLQLGEFDLRTLPLSERKRLLGMLVPGRGLVRALDHVSGDGTALYEFCLHHELEGVVAKRMYSAYRGGPKRGTDWVKIKCERDDDFVVVGWTPGKGARRELGALLLGSRTPSGALAYRGKVGSGLDGATASSLLEVLRGARTETAPAGLVLPKRLGSVMLTEPSVVVSVGHVGWTDDGKLRHPVLRGVRVDVAPDTCTASPKEEETTRLSASILPASRLTSSTVALTNQEKVFWPDDGYTKGDMLAYYAAVAPVMLPHLRNRPVVLVRYPDGIEGESFHQWRPPAGAPRWIRTLEVGHDRERTRTLVVDDVDGLLYVANLGCIDIHMSAAREGGLEQCDFVVIDFDLGGQPLRQAVTLAQKLREILQDLGVEGYPKTSGQSGLHVLIGLGPGVSFVGARTLAELLGRLLVSAYPTTATMERTVARRGPRVYVDTGQVGSTRTIVAPYSLRARAGAPVSTPLSWDEVNTALDPSRFSMVTVLDRISSAGDPMRSLLDVRPDLAQALARLERWVRG